MSCFWNMGTFYFEVSRSEAKSILSILFANFLAVIFSIIRAEHRRGQHYQPADFILRRSTRRKYASRCITNCHTHGPFLITFSFGALHLLVTVVRPRSPIAARYCTQLNRRSLTGLKIKAFVMFAIFIRIREAGIHGKTRSKLIRRPRRNINAT